MIPAWAAAHAPNKGPLLGMQGLGFGTKGIHRMRPIENTCLQVPAHLLQHLCRIPPVGMHCQEGSIPPLAGVGSLIPADSKQHIDSQSQLDNLATTRPCFNGSHQAWPCTGSVDGDGAGGNWSTGDMSITTPWLWQRHLFAVSQTMCRLVSSKLTMSRLTVRYNQQLQVLQQSTARIGQRVPAPLNAAACVQQQAKSSSKIECFDQ